MRFAAALMGYVARSIDKAASPPSLEAQIAKAILSLLPAKMHTIVLSLGRKYSRKDILAGLELLQATNQVHETYIDKTVVWTARDGGVSPW